MTAQTYLTPPAHFTRDEFRAYVNGLDFGAWKPMMPYLHNTGVPSLAQWQAMGATPQERWGANLDHYYAGMGWHAGPHAVACPDYIWVLCDLTKPGVAQSCSNALAWAIEMVGNYEVGGDDFATGAGARVGDNAAFAIAVMAEKIGWGDLSDYAFNQRGLHFHHDCAQDHHVCPGSKVTKPFMLSAIAQHRRQLGDLPFPPSTKIIIASGYSSGSLADVQARLNAAGASPPLAVDGHAGPLTRAAITAFQGKHGLFVDGLIGPLTWAALEKAS